MRWLPNALTILRILLIPLFCWLIFRNPGREVGWALLVFAAASCTDWLDGYLARKWKVISNFGKLADPLADKLLVLSALAALTWLPPFKLLWPIFVLIAARELAITVLREIYKRRGIIIPADKLGKWKTALQMVGIIAALALWAWRPQLPPAVIIAANAWFLLVAALTLYSGWNYIRIPAQT